MNLQRLMYTKLFWRFYSKNIPNVQSTDVLNVLCKQLNIGKDVAEHLIIKQPVIKKLDHKSIDNLVQTVYNLGYDKEVLIEKPQLFSLLPVTIRFRYQVLQECAISEVNLEAIYNYLTIVRQKRIGELKEMGLIPKTVNVEHQLASYMSKWPTSLTTSVWGDVNDMTLFELRLKIIERYLELVLDLSQEEFSRGITTYPTIKHRPLEAINETLTILLSQIMMSPYKIKSNLFLIHADPDNLKNILYKLRYLGGIDVREVIRMHPKIALKNYLTMIEIKKVLSEYNISDEAQRRCFDIFTLSANTVQERLENAKNIPEFSTFYNHPRFLKMIHYHKTATKRLHKLYKTNKKCVSLNILSGSSAHYETFEKAPGDRLGKAKDLIFCISQSLGSSYKSTAIRNQIKRHPFWINIPLIQVRHVYQELSKQFTSKEIFENCPILLYPWSKIKDILKIFNGKQTNTIPYFENIDLQSLSKSQKLSLLLYALEKSHYFTGNGVWGDDKK